MNPRAKRETTLRFLARPGDVNFGGNVHGGAVMSWIDQAGYTCATVWSGRYCVTILAGGIRFYRPIHIGNLVEVRALVVHTGRTSMYVAVEVFSTDPKVQEFKRTTRCIMVFVAVDEDGKTTPVPTWEPKEEHDIALQKHAMSFYAARQALDKELTELEELMD
jgi:uncharacterized protein (TIGR00369 family)